MKNLSQETLAEFIGKLCTKYSIDIEGIQTMIRDIDHVTVVVTNDKDGTYYMCGSTMHVVTLKDPVSLITDILTTFMEEGARYVWDLEQGEFLTPISKVIKKLE